MDFLLEYDHDHNLTRSFYEEWYQSSQNINMEHYYLSPILDASSARRILFCPVEVKPSHGDYAEASLQMGIISRAAQMKIPQRLSVKGQNSHAPSTNVLHTDGQCVKDSVSLARAAGTENSQRENPFKIAMESSEELGRSELSGWLPTPGLTVVGHSWALHWTYRKKDGSSVRESSPSPSDIRGLTIPVISCYSESSWAVLLW